MDKSFKGTKEEYIEFRRKRNISNKKYYSKPEVKVQKKRYKKQYDIENKVKISEYGYKLRAKPEYQQRIKKWHEEHKEYLIKYNKKWREKNKEKKKKMDSEYRKKVRANPIFHNKDLKRQKIMREEHPEWIKKYNKKYNSSLKGKLNWTKQNHLRLSKKYGNEFKLTSREIKEIYERDKVCVYCGSNEGLELDHIIPIIKNGKSTYFNFVLACRSCNPSKSDKDVFEWCKLKSIEVPIIVLNNLNSLQGRVK